MNYSKMDKQISYQSVIDHIKIEIRAIVSQLKVEQSKDLLAKKKEFDRALAWLKRALRYQIIA